MVKVDREMAEAMQKNCVTCGPFVALPSWIYCPKCGDKFIKPEPSAVKRIMRKVFKWANHEDEMPDSELIKTIEQGLQETREAALIEGEEKVLMVIRKNREWASIEYDIRKTLDFLKAGGVECTHEVTHNCIVSDCGEPDCPKHGGES